MREAPTIQRSPGVAACPTHFTRRASRGRELNSALGTTRSTLCRAACFRFGVLGLGLGVLGVEEFRAESAPGDRGLPRAARSATPPYIDRIRAICGIRGEGLSVSRCRVLRFLCFCGPRDFRFSVLCASPCLEPSDEPVKGVVAARAAGFGDPALHRSDPCGAGNLRRGGLGKRARDSALHLGIE